MISFWFLGTSVADTLAQRKSLYLSKPASPSYGSHYLKDIWLGGDFSNLANLSNVLGMYTVFKDSSDDLYLDHGSVPFVVGDKIIANLSTNPSKDQPGSTDMKALLFYYSIESETALTEANAPWNKGKSFKGNEIACLSSLNLDGRANYVITVKPAHFCPDGGTAGVITGKVTHDAGALFTAMHPYAIAWLTSAAKHKVEYGQAVIDNLTALKEFLPSLPPNTNPVADPFCQFAAVPQQEQEGALLDVCSRLTERLQQFLHSSVPQAVGGGLSSPANVDDSTLGGNHAPPDVQNAGACDEVARRIAVGTLVHGRVIKGSDGSFSFVAPNFRQETKRAISHPKKTTAAVAFVGCFVSMTKQRQGCRDMFLRLCDPSIVADKVWQAWAVHLKGAGVFYTFESVDDFQSCNAGLTLSCFLPDNKSLANQRRAANAAIDARMNEEFMGENPEKLSKLPTTALVQTNFSSLRALLVVVANLSLMASVWVQFDATTNAEDAPLLHALGFQLGDLLHEKKFNDWFFLQTERIRMAFLYWLFSTTNAILQAILQLGANESHIQAVLLDSPELIDGAEWFAIENDIAQAEASIASFVKGTAPVPENNLFLSSDYHTKAEEKKQAQLLAALQLKSPGFTTPGRPSPGKRKQVAPPVPPAEGNGDQVTRKEGELRWDASQAKGLGWQIPPPPHIPGLQSLCLMHVVESRGCQNKACQFRHPAKFSDWDKRTVALWDKHVKATPGLSWHPDIVAEVGKLSLTDNP